MADLIETLKALTTKKGIPYTYKVGEKSTSKGLPFDVNLSIDEDFKKVLLKSVGIFSLSIGAGIAAGIVISNKSKKQ